MKYKKLILSGLERFSLNQFNKIEIDFTNDVSVILGTNGCGKSSLLKQLVALPPDKSSFYPGGYKHSFIEHKGSDYLLKFHNGQTVTHTFIKDGIVVYEGHHSGMMSKLVQEHFGLTKEVVKMILGEIKFTDLSSSQRGELFIQLCESDFTYAVEVYNKLKAQHRDRLGAIRMLSAKLIELGKDQLDESSADSLVSHAKELHSTLNNLLMHRVPIDTNEFALSNSSDAVNDNLLKGIDAAAKLLEQVKTPQSDQELQQSFSALQKKQQYLSNLVEINTKLYKDARAEYSAISGSSERAIAYVKAKALELQEKIDDTAAQMITNDLTINVNSGLYELIEARSVITELAGSTEVNVGKYTTLSLVEFNNEKLRLTKDKSNLHARVNYITAQCEHLIKHKQSSDVNCPQCGHGFKPYYSDALLQRHQADLELIQAQLDKCTQELSSIEETIEKANRWKEQYYTFLAIVNKSPNLRHYFDIIKKNDWFRKNPKAMVTILPKIQTDLELLKIKQDLVSEREKLLSKINVDQTVSDGAIVGLECKIAELEKTVEATALKYTKVSALLMNVNTELQSRAKLKQVLVGIESLMDKNNTLYEAHKELLRRQTYNSIVEVIQSELALKEHALRKNESAKELFNQTQKQLDGYKEQASDIKLLIDGLSPTDGIIAEGLFGFMNRFISQMNTLIESIWNYPLSVKMPEIVEGDKLELDYKFPLLQADKVLPDVSMGSEAMLYIVNLSFRITALNYYGQLGMLILDEPFTALDEAHKVSAANALNAIVQEKVFEQVYMVSHYSSMHEAFKNASFIALNKMNITVPSNCNECVTFD